MAQTGAEQGGAELSQHPRHPGSATFGRNSPLQEQNPRFCEHCRVWQISYWGDFSFFFSCLREVFFGKCMILKEGFLAQFGQFVLPAQRWRGSFFLVTFMSVTSRFIHRGSKPRALPLAWRKNSPGLGAHVQIPLVCGVTEQSSQVGPLQETSL